MVVIKPVTRIASSNQLLGYNEQNSPAGYIDSEIPNDNCGAKKNCGSKTHSGKKFCWTGPNIMLKRAETTEFRSH